jgi:hypothetical protein
LSKQGLRERIVQIEKAPGTPFDHGRFELVVESVDGSSVVDSLPANGATLVQIGRRKSKKQLIICRNCDRHVFAGTTVCPFCNEDVLAAAKRYEMNLREARKAYQRLLKLLPTTVAVK